MSATASKSMPSVSSNSTGVSAPSSSSFSSTHGSRPSPSSSPKLAAAMPTGTTPRASGTSWLAQLTVATRSGLASMAAVPSACSMVIGNSVAAAVGEAPADDDDVSSPAALLVEAALVGAVDPDAAGLLVVAPAPVDELHAARVTATAAAVAVTRTRFNRMERPPLS